MLYYLSTMLELRHIKKDYYVDKQAYPALKDVSIAFEDVGFVAILGPSGCGKTTLLNIIGGLDEWRFACRFEIHQRLQGFRVGCLSK